MTILLALAGAALCGIACVSNDARAYLWAPGVLLLALAFQRATRPPANPRPGYIHDTKDQHERHD